jgi:SAM-dependent methyltransferase
MTVTSDASTSRDALAHISGATLEHYDRHAESFWRGTRDHDVRQNIDALLTRIEGAPPFAVLDLGCGPGRDLATFRKLGHVATGLDGAAAFVEMARAYSGCEVLRQDLLHLDLSQQCFDGVFANASLFHVPTSELPRVLVELRAALKTRGVLFASNPHGSDEEGWNRGRYGAYHAPATWRRHVTAAGFDLLDEYFRPAGLSRTEQPWLATVWRKSG